MSADTLNRQKLEKADRLKVEETKTNDFFLLGSTNKTAF